MDGSTHRRIFRDIVRGYSSSTLNDRLIYIKHLTPHDQVELEEIEEKYYNIALQKGVPNEEDMLIYLKDEEQWTDEDEKFIEDKKIFIESLNKAKSKMVLKKQMDAQSKLIEEESKALQEKQNQKIGLLGNTCEKYAKDRIHDFYMIKSFFKDAKLKKPMFSEDEFDEIEGKELNDIVVSYNTIFQNFSEENVQHTILNDFYSPYLSFCEDSIQFYGKPFCELTYNQIRLIVYSRVFKNIFDQNENIPEQIKKDPKKLLDYGSISKEERDKMREKISGGDGGTLVGAGKEDYEYLGIEQPVGAVDLHEEAKKKGGQLDMQDLMKLHGVEGA